MFGLSTWLGWKVIRHGWKRVIVSAFGVAIAFSFIATIFFVGDSVHYALVQNYLEPLADLDMELVPNGTTYLDGRVEVLLRQNESLMNLVDAISPRFIIRSSVGINFDDDLVLSGVTLMGMNVTKDAPIGPFYSKGSVINSENILGAPIDSSSSVNDSSDELPAAITESLASQLRLEENDLFTLQFSLDHGQVPKELVFRVKTILDTRGKIAFYSQETVVTDLTSLQRHLNLDGNITSVAISWHVPEHSSISQERVQELIEGNISALLEENGYQGKVKIVKIRELFENGVERVTSNMIEFFSAMGLAPGFAALTLIIVIFYLLVEERRKELGTLKAMGFTSWEIAIHLLLEATFLILVSSIVGLIMGIGTTLFVLSFLNMKPPEGWNYYFISGVRYGWTYELLILPESVVKVILLGSIVALMPTLIATWNISRLNPINVLHEHEESLWEVRRRNVRKSLGVLVLTLVFGMITIQQFTVSADIFIVGLILTLSLLYFVLAWLLPKRKIISLLLSVLNLFITYHLIQLTLVPSFWQGEHPSALGMAMLLLFAIIVSCVLLTQLLPFLVVIASSLAAPLRSGALPLLHAITELRHHHTRTLLVLTLFGLVVSMALTATIFSATREIGIQNELTRGYTLHADFVASLAIPLNNFSEWQARARQYSIDEHLTLLAAWQRTNARLSFKELTPKARDELEGQEYFSVVGIDNSARDLLNLTLVARNESLSEDVVWQKVLSGQAVFFPFSFYQFYQVPLTEVTIEGFTKNVTVPSVGFLHADVAAIYISKSLFDQLFPTVNGTRNLYFSLNDRARQDDMEYLMELQSNLTKALLPWGPVARSTKVVLSQITPVIQATFQTMVNYIYLGIIIGIVGIMLVTSRKIHRSRFEFGVLMSFGATRKELSIAVILEVLFFVVTSIVIGIFVPPVFFGVVLSVTLDAPLIIPLDRVARWSFLILAATLASALFPLRQLQKLEPATIMREIEG